MLDGYPTQQLHVSASADLVRSQLDFHVRAAAWAQLFLDAGRSFFESDTVLSVFIGVCRDLDLSIWCVGICKLFVYRKVDVPLLRCRPALGSICLFWLVPCSLGILWVCDSFAAAQVLALEEGTFVQASDRRSDGQKAVKCARLTCLT